MDLRGVESVIIRSCSSELLSNEWTGMGILLSIGLLTDLIAMLVGGAGNTNMDKLEESVDKELDEETKETLLSR